MKNILYASFIRFPSEKAHALYVAQVCDSLSAIGCDVELLVPRRMGRSKEEAHVFYALKHKFNVQYLPCIDLLWLPLGKAVSHKVGLVSFAFSVYVSCLLKRRSRETVLCTNDSVVALLLSFLSVRVVYELHDYPVGNWWFYRVVARRVYKIQTNNKQKIEMVTRDLLVPETKVFAVYNGVSISEFDISLSKTEARQKLQLPVDRKLVVYTGHLYDWKGAQTLAEAAKIYSDTNFIFVGGTKQDLKTFKQLYGRHANITLVGHRPHAEIPVYLKAADVLVLPNSGKSVTSMYHTSPMKLFEYMASGRPIIASRLPSIEEVVTDTEVFYVPPDDPEALAKGLGSVLANEPASARKVKAAAALVRQFDWNTRAKIVIKNIS